jgi:hypothetical protein
MRLGLWTRLGVAAAAGVLFGGLAVTLSAGPASAGLIFVNCSIGGNLQTTINSASTGDTIFVSGTCSGNFTIAKNLTLQGERLAILDGGDSGTVLTVTSGTTVYLDALTIRNGNNPGVGAYASGLQNSGTTTLNNSTVSGNTGYFGGGIENYLNATMTLNGSTVSDNTSAVSLGNYASDGGGIANNGTMTLTSSTVSGNTSAGSVAPPAAFASSGDGGGIYNSGTTTLNNSKVSGNTAPDGGYGGGISNNGFCGGCLGRVTLNSSTVSGNSALNGGGIYNYDATMTLNGSTVSGNTSSVGGGIYNFGGTMTLTSSTVSGNTAIPSAVYPV